MTKKKRFKRGQLFQDRETSKIYIYVKSLSGGKAHAVELNDNGDPISIVIVKTKNLGKVELVPETFKSISI